MWVNLITSIKLHDREMNKTLLDGPSIPGLLQSIKILSDPLNTLDEWEKQYGEIFQLRANSKSPTIVISNPDHIRTVLTAPSESIASSEIVAPRPLKPVLHGIALVPASSRF